MFSKKQIFSLFLAIVMLITIVPWSAIKTSASYNGALQFDETGKFTVMQVADIQESVTVNSRVIALLQNAITRYSPDLVVFTGDNQTGGTLTYQLVINKFLAPLLDTDTKFAVTFGNHDEEGTPSVSKQTQYNYYKSKGGNNFIDHDVAALDGVGSGSIPIYGYGQTGGIPAFQVFLMDSGSYESDSSYSNPQTNQVDYYITTNPTVPSLWFQHIPVPEIYNVLSQVPAGTSNSVGGSSSPFSSYNWAVNPSLINWTFSGSTNPADILKEGPCPCNLSTAQASDHRSSSAYGSKTLYEAWEANGNMKGAFFGHDHKNSFVGTTTDGITLGYSKAATLNSYNDGNPGVRIFQLDIDGTYTTKSVTENDLTFGLGDYTAVNNALSAARVVKNDTTYYRANNINDPNYYNPTSTTIGNGVYAPAAFADGAVGLTNIIAGINYDLDSRSQSIIDSYAASISSAWQALSLKSADYSTVNQYRGYTNGTAILAPPYYSSAHAGQWIPREEYTDNSLNNWDVAYNGVTRGLKIPSQPLVNGYSSSLLTAYQALRLKSDTNPEPLAPFDTSVYRRPTPNIALDVSDIIRVGASGDTVMGSGTTIKKATPSGVPYVTGTYAAQAYAGESPVWPTIEFSSSAPVNITSVTVNGTGVAATPALAGGGTTSTTAASWEIRGGTANAGTELKVTITYTYTWYNSYTGVYVTDTYSTNGCSYVENIIFPSGNRVFYTAYNKTAGNSYAADAVWSSRLLGKGVYGLSLHRTDYTTSSPKYQAGYMNSAANTFVSSTNSQVPENTCFFADVDNSGNGDYANANGAGSYSSGDPDRGRTNIYIDTSTQSLKDNNVRMHFFINSSIRSGSNGNLTWETIHAKDGDTAYTGTIDNSLGASSSAAWAALNPSGPKDGTVSDAGAPYGGFRTAGSEITSFFTGTGAAGTYTLVNQWTAKGRSWLGTTPWQQTYYGITIQIINYTKETLRSNLNAGVGTTIKPFNGSNDVTTIVTANGSDPLNGGIVNSNKGKNPQSWYYSAGWPNYITGYNAAWLQMNKPNTDQTSIDNAAADLNANYNGLTLRSANYTNCTSQDVMTGLGNTYYGSSVAPLDVLISAVQNNNITYGNKLDRWTVGGNSDYTAASAASLNEVYDAAIACQNADYNVLYQPYVDYIAQQLKAAIDGLQYAIYTVNFNGNGNSSGTMPFVAVTVGESVSLPENNFFKTGYSFQGWATSESGSVIFENQGIYEMGNSDVTLFAVWSPNEYTITFDINGGTGSPPLVQSGVSGTILTLPAQQNFSRQYYDFLGWAVSPDAKVPLTSYAITGEDFILYAVWREATIAISPQDGSTAVINQSNHCIYGLKPQITKDEFESQYAHITGKAELTYTFVNGSFGTGTRVDIIDKTTSAVLDTYYIVIYGDVNGDGNVDAQDSDNCINVQNWKLTWNHSTQGCFYLAGDLNNDGNIDVIDADIITEVSNYKMQINQVTGLAV